MASTTETPDFNKLAAAYRAEFRPAGLVQQSLVDTIIHAQWNTLRLRAMEDQVWEKLFAGSEDQSPAEAFIADCKGPKVLEKLHRFLEAHQRAYNRAVKELRKLQAAAPAEDANLPAPAPVMAPALPKTSPSLSRATVQNLALRL